MTDLYAKALLIDTIIKASTRLTTDKLINDMTMALQNVWDTEARQAIANTLVLVRNSTILSPSDLEAISDSLALQLGAPVAALAIAATSKTTQAGYRAGFKDAVKSDVKFSVTTADINSLNVLKQNTGLWSGDYYGSKLEQATKSALAPYFEGVSSTKDVAYDIKIAMENTLLAPKTYQYWKLFAKQAIVQTRSIGQVSGYEAGGFEVIRVKAIIDERTSEICLRLNGTVISVRDLRRQIDKWQGAVKKGNKEAAKKAWPHWSDKQASKLTSQSKINSAVKGGKIGSPPYHMGCRTTTVVEFQGKAGQKILTTSEKNKIDKVVESRKPKKKD